jgi:hypothetical protein
LPVNYEKRESVERSDTIPALSGEAEENYKKTTVRIPDPEDKI